jgi:hypothetical protein
VSCRCPWARGHRRRLLHEIRHPAGRLTAAMPLRELHPSGRPAAMLLRELHRPGRPAAMLLREVHPHGRPATLSPSTASLHRARRLPADSSPGEVMPTGCSVRRVGAPALGDEMGCRRGGGVVTGERWVLYCCVRGLWIWGYTTVLVERESARATIKAAFTPGPCLDPKFFSLNFTMKKEISYYIKMLANAWSTKCR